VRFGELSRRDVDGEPQVGGPVARIGAGARQKHVEHLPDPSNLLGQRDEGCRRDDAAYGVLPAGKDLETDESVAIEGDERLIIGDDLAGCDGAAEIDLEKAAFLP